jgi:hypothetical protein
MKKNLAVILGLVALVAFAASPVQAACGLSTQPVSQGLGTFFDHCPDANPVAFYAYLIASPSTANSNGQDGACEAAGAPNGIQQACTPESGVAGDGNIQALYDWGSFNAGSTGCPSPLGDTEGGQPVAVQMVANNGASVIASTGYDIGLGGYDLDFAFPFDGSSFGTISCDFSNAPVVTSSSAGPSPDLTQVCVHINPTKINSDCDPASAGAVVGTCPTGVAPAVALGKLYTRSGPCGQSPDPRLSTGWTLAPVQPDAGGNACNAITQISGSCNYIGATGNLAGVETLAVAGSLRIQDAAASVDKVKIDKAQFEQGKLLVSFSTVNETSIVGFNVYAGTTKLNSGLVQAKGTGSNSYSFEAGRSDVKANKTVTVEAVKSDGSVVKSSPAMLK